MRIALACLLVISFAACGKKPAAKSGGSAPPAATAEDKAEMKESTSKPGSGADKDDAAKKSKRSGDPCEGGE